MAALINWHGRGNRENGS